MCSWLVTVLLLLGAANSRGQSAMEEGVGFSVPVGLCLFPPTGAQVPITSYTCTQPNIAGFLDQGQCTVSGELRRCAIKEGALPALLSSSADLGVYGWHGMEGVLVCICFPSQVHKCPSQATHVHNLT